MCGIFGVINFNGQPVDKEKVLSARDILAHRGPDDSGLYLSSYNHSSIQPCVALAHRRLSIIDLSPSAHQPMTTEDGRFTIVFNGEIFNYEELREPISSKQLAVSQNQFRTNSDTEVILKLYAMEGSDCLKRLRGMFAFAIWDDKEKKLFTARDRFGIKSFYYLHNDNEFIFSSELKAIKKYKNGLTLSMEGMDAFLKTGSVPAPLTIYEETKALIPGHWLECQMEDGRWKMKIKQYWHFFDLVGHPELVSGSDLSLRFGSNRRSNLNYDDETKKIIRNSLLDSIKAHMVSDVEVGAFLSGGIDSTAIVSLMRQAGHDKIKTISVTFPGHQLDESKYSNLAAKKYETNHFEYRLQEDELINDFDKIIEAMDQPTIDGINTYFVSKAAASFGLKVVLSGLGGDELFGGYPSFINIPKYQRIKSLPFSRSLMKIAGTVLKGKIPAKAVEYFKNPDTPNAEYKLIRGLFTDSELRELGWRSDSRQAAYRTGRAGMTDSEQVGMTTEDQMSFWQSPESDEKMSNIKWQMENALQPMTNDLMTNDQFTNDPMTKDYFSRIVIASGAKQSPSVLQYISYLETCIYMRNQLLRDSDVFSMTHSLELRVPFVDHLLYGSVLLYLDDGFDKSFPKKKLVDGVGDLPDEIVHRPKQGFTFPFADWIRGGQISDTISDSLASSKMKKYFNPQALLNLQKSFKQNKIHWSRVWALYIASSFGK